MIRRIVRRLASQRILWTVILAAVLLGVASVPIVSAHANLVESTPGQGEQVAEPPDELTLRYTEGVQQADISVVAADDDRVDENVRIDSDDPSVVPVPLEDVENGTYIVKWEVLSVDGHTTSGSFFFTVGDELPTREQLLSTYAADDNGESVNPGESVFRALLLGGVIILVGAPLTLVFAVYPLAQIRNIGTAEIDRGTHYLVGGGLLAVLLSATALAIIRMTASHSLSVDVLRQFVTTDLGRAWLAQTGVVLLLGIITVFGAMRRPRFTKRGWLWVVVAGGILVQLTVSWTSHSAAVTNGFWGMVADLGHLLGAALWVGGLVILATVAPTLLTRASDDVAQLAAQLIRRFTLLAIAGVTVSVETGLVIAAWHVPTVDSLGTTLYGTVLSVKVILVLIALALGGFNRFILHRQLRMSEQRHEDRSLVQALLVPLPIPGPHSSTSARETIETFVRSVRIELILLVAVVLISGVLTSIPTAANAMDQDESANEIVFESETDNVTVTLRVVPGQVGPNVFDVQFTQDGEPVSADEPVTILLRHPERDTSLPQMELNQTDPGQYSTVAVIPRNGTWELRVNTWSNGTYISDRHTINVSSTSRNGQMGRTQPQRQSTGGDFPKFLRLSALGVAIAGIVAVGYEINETIIRERDG